MTRTTALTRDEQLCRMGLLGAAMLHWIAAILMLWQRWFPHVSDMSGPESGTRLAQALLSLVGAA